MLAQVAGRAGRKDSLGEVVVQTYMPEEPAILATRTHDYEGFYEHEIEARRALEYPPFSRLARIVVESEAEGSVQRYAAKIVQELQKAAVAGVTVLGPSPAVLSRLNRQFRYTCLIKASSPGVLQNVATRVRHGAAKIPRGMKLVLDVDPIDML